MAVIKRDLSVIVPTLEYPYVDAAVAGLMKQSAPAGCYEVVVADSREGRWADAIQKEAAKSCDSGGLCAIGKPRSVAVARAQCRH